MTITDKELKAGEQIRRANEAERAQAGVVPVTLYVCPKAGCGSYYGVRGMPDLDQIITGGVGLNGEPHPERERPRSHCPDCWDRGETVIRKRVNLKVRV